MKLSEKGLDKLYGLDLEMALGFQVSFETLVFKPEDFTGAVVLTVEEAQLCLKLAIGSLIVPFGKKGPPKWVKETIEMLRSRIEQAEK